MLSWGFEALAIMRRPFYERGILQGIRVSSPALYNGSLTSSRFHAWQSALLFTAVMIFHLVFLSWSKFLSWFFFIGDLFVMVWLALKAYQDADTLDRYVCWWSGE